MTVNRARMHVAAAALAAVSIACGGSQDPAATGVGGDTSAVRTTALSDAFNTFDTSVWQKSNWANGSPFNCGFLPDHVGFSGGVMSLKLDNVPSSGRGYSCGEYRTNDTFGYGRFEVRMRAAKASGIVSSFFVYTGSPWDEIDVEILGKNTSQVQFNYFVNGVGGHERLVDLGFDASAGYHTYAFDWKAGSISWYVDGVMKHTVSGGTLPSHPAQIMMNLWNGIGVDGWLGAFNYPGPLYAYYDSATYTPPSGGGGGGGTGASCANPITFTNQSGNFNTTGVVCLRTSATVNGWGCSNFAGRTVSVNGGAASASCGAGPFPLPKAPDGYTYFSVTAGTYPWASLYAW